MGPRDPVTRQERLLGLDAAVALRCHVPSACREHIHTINAPLLGILKNLEEFVEVLMPRSKYRFDSDLVVIFAYLQELFDPSGSAIFLSSFKMIPIKPLHIGIGASMWQ